MSSHNRHTTEQMQMNLKTNLNNKYTSKLILYLSSWSARQAMLKFTKNPLLDLSQTSQINNIFFSFSSAVLSFIWMCEAEICLIYSWTSLTLFPLMNVFVLSLSLNVVSGTSVSSFCLDKNNSNRNMIKLFVIVVLLHSCVVRGQRGSFVGSSNKPLCVGVGDHVRN